ncbi:MAG: monoamine oxidase [Thermoleophilaceae bacterium]|nr:monoamine oxidase [Thermoleophilaceae bacterium]
MPRTPLAQRLSSAFAAAAPSEKAGAAAEDGLTRRQALGRAGALGASAAAAATIGRFASPASAAGNPSIAVVGGGLAGLSCAYALKNAGYTSQVYEASTRWGGRCWTIRSFDGGQLAEHGGELIDQGHTAVRQLSQQLGLSLDNLLQAEKNGAEPFYWFDGKPYTFTQATNDLKVIWQQIHSDVSAASYPTLYNLSTARGRELDAMSITDWIKSYVPGGMKSSLGQLLDVAYNIEYGAECSQQSSLNMLYLLGYSGQGQFRVFGPSNEKYHVRGGNDQISDGLRDRLAGQLNPGHELVAIKRTASGGYSLTFNVGLATKTVSADRVVLAIPFSILRSSVDIRQAGFSPRKQTAIAELGMGTNSKLHLQFSTRHWESLGNQGDTYSDTGYQTTWDVTRAQGDARGILVDYTGGKIGASFGSGTPESRATQFLGQIEPVLPGITQKWNGKATVDYWTGYPWTKGSYSYWKVGQYTKFAGAEREQEGLCHFAGEHTSIDFQGYLNGAVESGQRAAGEIIGQLK